jgi:hypothetical protein
MTKLAKYFSSTSFFGIFSSVGKDKDHIRVNNFGEKKFKRSG